MPKAETPAPEFGEAGAPIAGTYNVVRRLGTGGMGEVFEARHERLGMVVALKTLRRDRADEPVARARLEREARALAAVKSDNVVRVFDYIEGPDAPILVMEHLQGQDLRALLRHEGPLDARRAIHIALDACRGLAALHAAGIVHRDVKPSNLFVTRDSLGREVTKVVDLGVARIEHAELTLEGAMIGTLRYMAPEQLVDSSCADSSVDVYAAAGVLYECLTGRPAQPAETVEQLMFDILNRTPQRASELRAGLPRALDGLLASALAREVTQRPANVSDFARRLEALLDERATSRPSEGDETDQTERGDLRSALPTSRAQRRQRGEMPVVRQVRSSTRRLAMVLSVVGIALAALGARTVVSAKGPPERVARAPGASASSQWAALAPRAEPRSTTESAPVVAPSSAESVGASPAKPSATLQTRRSFPSSPAKHNGRPASDALSFDPTNPYGP